MTAAFGSTINAMRDFHCFTDEIGTHPDCRPWFRYHLVWYDARLGTAITAFNRIMDLRDFPNLYEKLFSILEAFEGSRHPHLPYPSSARLVKFGGNLTTVKSC